MLYHFNPTTGKQGLCQAKKGRCPFTHGATGEEAQAAYEASVEPFAAGARKASVQELQALPASLLRSTPLKELGATELSQTIRHEARELGFSAESIDSAIDLASVLHSHQTRGNRGSFATTPYIEHPLRNSLRLLRLGVQDQDIIIASLLHDTVEDGAQVFAKKLKGRELPELEARDLLRNHIEAAYGERVREIVDAVTNDYLEEKRLSSISLEDRHASYRKHVEENITGAPAVFLVKLSDFIDNATGLYHNDTPEREKRTKKQAIKYRPLVPIFLRELDALELPLNAEKKLALREQLAKTTVRLTTIIDR